MKLSGIVASAVALAAAFALHADVFTYVDHWPSGSGDETATAVVVPDNTTAAISTAEDVTRVARLTSISLGGSAAEVDYTASDALALAASVSGSGKFSAISSGNLTLSGDNSGLLSPGCFFFSNMAVTVASRYGLGSTGSATLHYWFGGKKDPLHFTGAGLTNDAPIRVHQGTQDFNFYLGPDNASETLVILNDLIVDSGNGNGRDSDLNKRNAVFFRNKVRFRGGMFGIPTTVNGYLCCRVASGASAEVWFEENGKPSFYYWPSYGNLRYHLDWSEMKGLKYVLSMNETTVYAECEQSNVLSGLYQGVSGNGTYDLNGLDQSVKGINKVWGSPKFTSATPATFTVTSYATGANNISSSAKFSGKVNFTYSPASATGAYTLTGSGALSTSCGALTVGGAGHLIFSSGAGWSGTNVVVQSGATLELNSEKAMTNTTATLTVEAGGNLVLRAGAACMAKNVTIAGVPLDAGTVYTVAKLRDEMGLPVDGDDNASIVVSEDSHSEWHGWPTTPGAIAEVPAGVTVYVSDEDVATLEALGGINLGLGAAVICTNLTEELDLSAPVSGVGSFQALNSDKIVLSGDNSGLLSPGCFFFSNTAVTVASRYGLGSTNTAQLVYWFGGKVDPLHFTGAGLTNDAPVRVHQGTASKNFVLGPDNADETLVIANDFIFDGDYNSGTKDIYFRNNVRIRAGTFGANSVHIWAYVSGTSAEVWFEEDVKVKFNYWYMKNNLRAHLDWSGVSGNHNWIAPYSPVVAVCERSGVLGYLAQGIAGSGTIDLNGFDQSAGKTSRTYGSPIVTSETPATYTMTSYDVSDTAINHSSTKFSGKVNFTYNPGSASGAYTLTGSAALSDSSGKLTVASGSLTFANGAGWSGTNVVVKSGAKLAVGEVSMPVAFGSKAVLGHHSWTKLEIESGGTLELAASESPAVVRSFVYNGQMKPAGRYTSASGVGITGDGVLYVRSSTDGEPGAMIIFY